MSRRMVIRCDECEKQADMVYPKGPQSTSVSVFSTAPIWDLKPIPPAGWLEMHAAAWQIADLCSPECVQRWNARHQSGDGYA